MFRDSRGRGTRISCTRSCEKRPRLGRLLSRPTSSAAFDLVQKVLSREWAGQCQGGKRSRVVGQTGQGSRARSGVSKPRGSYWNCGKDGHRMVNCTTKRKSGPPGKPQQTTAESGATTSGQQSSLQQSVKQGLGPASRASRKGAQQGARFFKHMRAFFLSDGQQEGLDTSATVLPPVSSVPSQGRQPPEAGAPVPAWRALQTDEVTVF